MGVDCRIYLPAQTQVRDVATVLGCVTGLPGRRCRIDAGCWYWQVSGMVVQGDRNFPECCFIEWMDGASEERRLMYHHETRTGERLLMPRSTPLWLAVGRRLVQFFGGRMIPQDCAGEELLRAPAPCAEHPEDGAEWQAWQERLAAVEPLTPVELAWGRRRCAYQDVAWRLPDWEEGAI